MAILTLTRALVKRNHVRSLPHGAVAGEDVAQEKENKQHRLV
jgi:hypothetical protein